MACLIFFAQFWAWYIPLSDPYMLMWLPTRVWTIVTFLLPAFLSTMHLINYKNVVFFEHVIHAEVISKSSWRDHREITAIL